MIWLFFVIPIFIVVVIAIIYDIRTKREGLKLDSSFDEKKDELRRNEQAQNDMHRVYENNDFFL